MKNKFQIGDIVRVFFMGKYHNLKINNISNDYMYLLVPKDAPASWKFMKEDNKYSLCFAIDDNHIIKKICRICKS